MQPSRKVLLALLRWMKRKRAAAKKRSDARKASLRSQARRRRLALVALAAVLDEEAQAGPREKRDRRKIVRSRDSWKGSCMYGYLYLQVNDDTKRKVYADNFRMTPKTFDKIASDISGSGLAFVPRIGAVKKNEVKPVSFKLGVCIYVLALGASTKTAADVASIGKSTCELWLLQFTEVCLKVLKPEYMPAKPLAPERVEQVRSEFAARRGISNAAMACDCQRSERRFAVAVRGSLRNLYTLLYWRLTD